MIRFLQSYRSAVLVVLMMLCFVAGVYAADGARKIEAYLREDFALKVDNHSVHLENPVLVYQGSSYLPLKEVGALLGAKTEWDDASRTILVTTSPSKPIDEADLGGSNSELPNTVRFEYPDVIRYSNIVKYKITDNKRRSALVLANEYNGVIYFRKADLSVFGIDYTGLQTVKEQHSSDIFIPADELKLRWGTPSAIEIVNNPIEYETDPEKAKALRAYLPAGATPTAHYVRQQGGANEYEILYQTTDNRFYVYKLKLIIGSNGAYAVQWISIDYLYD